MAGAIFGEGHMMLECHFLWQGQCLVKLQCHFSWQAQYLVNFGVIAGAPNVVIFDTKCVSKAGRGSFANGRVVAEAFLLGSWSDHSRIVPPMATTFQVVFVTSSTCIFSWQAQHLVKFT